MPAEVPAEVPAEEVPAEEEAAEITRDEIASTDDITSKPVILFLHIYKTGGTSNRELFANWAESEGARFAQAGSCPDGGWMSKLEPNNHDYICLIPLKGSRTDADGRTLVDMPTPRPSQMEIVAEELDVIAGHFAWGFDHFVHRTHKYVTCLRNPTARYVSDILYANRFTHKTSEMTLQQTVAFVEEHVMAPATTKYRGIYAARLSSRMYEKVTPVQRLAMINAGEEEQTEEQEQKAADMAIYHMQHNIAVVGLIEHYSVFVELVAALLDPLVDGTRKHDELWTSAYATQSNKHEGFDQSDVIPQLSVEATARLNEVLVLDWKVFKAGCSVTYQQCLALVDGKKGKLIGGDCTALRDTCEF